MTLSSTTFSSTEFREVLGHYPTGVVVVTAIDATGNPAGMVVGSFTSISLDPPLVAFSPAKSSGTYARLRTAQSFCVNVLAADQEDLCRRLAVPGSDAIASLDWTPAPNGAPVLPGVMSWVECSVETEVEAGDHYIVVGRVHHLAVARTGSPLLFFQGGYGRFMLPSIAAVTGPDVFEAVRAAEIFRTDVERCSAELAIDCSVQTVASGELVTVLSCQGSESPGMKPVGTRVPHVAPLGVMFTDGLEGEGLDGWLEQVRRLDPSLVDGVRSKREIALERGFSVSLHSDEVEQRLLSMSAYNSTATPKEARRIRELIALSADLYEPEWNEGERYDVYSITVAIETPEGCPPLVLRMTNVPGQASPALVREWAEALTITADEATRSLDFHFHRGAATELASAHRP